MLLTQERFDQAVKVLQTMTPPTPGILPGSWQQSPECRPGMMEEYVFVEQTPTGELVTKIAQVSINKNSKEDVQFGKHIVYTQE
jgi:hypothetical protein